MRCEECHRGVRTETGAGWPSLDDCLACHAFDVTKDPDVARLRAAARSGEAVRWAALYRLAPHVRFSHRAHAAKKVACRTCHDHAGERRDLEREDDRRGEELMDWCIACHREKNAATDCLTCHL
jgi:hypothetical protein